ncbi:uncharacterized protein K452DRAFT_293178 [Aplosporella prunicola CBS 121167]|uniref:Uncharacterized protein n=1 Tax=Aplosporella prunicola CBS 121167 TaxID=1176127 RepID=A0A6A6AX36_9PEZI|nr:uncharacterized protein K452DRAFT_293178 [Aplosporella prunicola CBS 121167]KAF2135494.1 hypothetical protein K452DRAFT_293178 [Aplosporella prunicola CBS 121167]
MKETRQQRVGRQSQLAGGDVLLALAWPLLSIIMGAERALGRRKWQVRSALRSPQDDMAQGAKLASYS